MAFNRRDTVELTSALGSSGIDEDTLIEVSEGDAGSAILPYALWKRVWDCTLLLLVCWRWRARLRIGLGVFSSVVYLGAVASLVAHQAILLHTSALVAMSSLL